MPTIETRKISQEAIDIIESYTAFDLEDSFRDGDFLYMLGIAFHMVNYSGESFASGQSKYVTWWSELYNVEIQANRVTDIVTVETSVIDYRKDGH